MKTASRSSVFVLAIFYVLTASSAHAATFYVSTTGDDTSGDGSMTNPWATIGHAVNSGIPAAGGDEVVVLGGTYDGMTTISRGFPSRVTVRAANPYATVLTNVTNGGEAIRVYVDGSANITISGFVSTNAHPTNVCAGREPYFIVHIQNAEDVTLENNIIFGNNAPGTCNELLKVNRSSMTAYPRNIVIRGNVFYDPANADGADMIAECPDRA